MLNQHIDELRHVDARDLHVHGLHDHLPHQNRHIRGARHEHLRNMLIISHRTKSSA